MSVPRVSAITVLGVTAVGISTTALIGPVVPDILAEFDRPQSQAGLVIGLSTLPAIVFSPVLGALSDRHGRSAVLRPCLFTFAVLGVASAFAPTFESFLLLRFLHGLPAAGLVVLALVIISDQWAGPDRATLMARNAALLTASLAVFPVVGGMVSDIAGWRSVHLLYLMGLVPLVGVPRLGASPAVTPPVALSRQLAGTIGLLRVGRIGAAVLGATIVIAFMFGWNITLMPLHAEQVLGLSASSRGLFVGAGAAVATATALIFGRRAASAPPLTVMLIAFAVFVLGWGLVWAGGPRVAVAGLGIAVTGIAQGIVGPTLQSVIAADAPEDRRGAALALWGSSIRTGQTLGPALIAVLLVFGTTGDAYRAGVASALILTLALGALSLRSRRRVVGAVT